MSEYYNFEISEHEISYEPYWYNKSKFLIFFVFGVLVLILAFAFYFLEDCIESLLIGLFISFALFLTGTYRKFVKNKTILVFNKPENSIYKITPFEKKKLTELQNIQTIHTVSKHLHYYYILNSKKNNAVKKIIISPSIYYEKKNTPEIRFLEMEIIPKIESFLQLKKDFTHYI